MITEREAGKENNDKKQGFSAPDASWFKGESIDYVKKKVFDLDSIFEGNTVKSLLNEHLDGKKNNRLLLWSLIYLQNFQKIYK